MGLHPQAFFYHWSAPRPALSGHPHLSLSAGQLFSLPVCQRPAPSPTVRDWCEARYPPRTFNSTQTGASPAHQGDPIIACLRVTGTSTCSLFTGVQPGTLTDTPQTSLGG